MIVQTAPEGAPRFVIRMAEHMALAALFGRAFGNDRFEPVEGEEVHYIIANHDAGWADLDEEYRVDPDTGLPFNLSETPFDLVKHTSTGSPDFNEAHHPLSGLLSSMHTWGLYHGRYGISDIVLLDKVGEQDKDAAKAMLDHEEARQDRLKQALAADSVTAAKVEEAKLMQAYKQLQFFDTLALYFNRIHEGAREPATFPKVPLNAEDDVDIDVRPLGEGKYRVSPWPFAGENLVAEFEGRYMEPLDAPADRADGADRLPVEVQTVTLVP